MPAVEMMEKALLELKSSKEIMELIMWAFFFVVFSIFYNKYLVSMLFFTLWGVQ